MQFMNKFKKQNKKKQPSDISSLFKQNLKYISQTEINPSDIENQFVKNNTRYYLKVGEIDCPSGKIVVADPLCYLCHKESSQGLEQTIPIGRYPVEVAICRNNLIGIRMTTARLKIRNTKAVKYILATEEIDSKNKKPSFSGFPVDAGMMCFCDQQVADEYRNFLDNWYKENPNGNHYDDYFSQFFKESFEKFPAYQREEGDFIEWKNPNTNHKMIMIASGLGDGFYQSFLGYDQENQICELIVPLINPQIFEK